jgi:large subunit ribosomal protein L6
MSRIGLAPITIPSGVEVKVDGVAVSVKGPKGTLSRTFSDRISIAIDDGVISVSRADDEPQSRSLHGLTRALLNNMVVGVSEGFTRTLELVGVGYRVSQQGKGLELLVGFSHPVKVAAVDGMISGIDKELVGQVAADIRSVRPPEPYKGKGIRYSDEVVRRKAGKSAVVTV